MEERLGDALLWAADCQYIQPCSEALGGRLRLRFHPQLPRTRWQRLLCLPGTKQDRAGIEYDQDTAKILRQCWLARRSRTEQAAVLDCLLAYLEAQPPDGTAEDSAAMLTWTATREMLLTEREDEHSWERLARLAHSEAPTSTYIRERLEHLAPGELRLSTTNRHDQQRRACILKKETPLKDAYPLKLIHYDITGLTSYALACSLAITALLGAKPAAWDKWQVGGLQQDEQLVLRQKQDQDWLPVIALPSERALQTGQIYQVAEDGEGDTDVASRPFTVGSASRITVRLDRGTGSHSLEMILVQPGSFLMGSPPEEEGRGYDETQHQVTLTQAFYLAKTETTQGAYEAVVGATSSQSKQLSVLGPVENVSHDDAVAFCQKLTDRERSAGRLPADWVYRLPTEAEWEYACRAGTKTAYSFGPSLRADQARFGGGNPESGPVDVGQYPANAWGFQDMHGNVLEWCMDWYGDYLPGPVVNPLGPEVGIARVLRGGSWLNQALLCRAAFRYRWGPGIPVLCRGFRLAAGRVERPNLFLATHGTLGEDSAKQEPPKPEEPKEILSSIGLKLVRIPVGSFTMGRPETEEHGLFDSDQVEVTISRSFYLAAYETTQAQWKAVIGASPSYFKGEDLPVESVDWDQAREFCRKLTERDQKAGVLPQGFGYDLPTEAQWEYACRAGTKTPFHYGDSLSSEQANFDGNFPCGKAAKGPYLEKTTAVGRYTPNAWGLYDMHGNVWEWCRDGYQGALPGGLDPYVADNANRVVRGGSWGSQAGGCRAAGRDRRDPGDRLRYQGLRLAAVRIEEPVRPE